MPKTAVSSGDLGSESAPFDTVEPGRVISDTDSTVVDGVIVKDAMTALQEQSPAMYAVIQWCAEKATMSDESSSASMEAMVRRALEADSIEAVLREEMTVDAKSILDIPVLVTGIRIGESDFNEGMPYYVLFDCQYGTPSESHVVTCGGFMVVTQAMKLDIEDAWPQVIAFKQSAKETKKGFRPLHLARAV